MKIYSPIEKSRSLDEVKAIKWLILFLILQIIIKNLINGSDN